MSNDLVGATLEDRLVNLCFERGRVVGRGMKGSEKSRSARQVTFGLSNRCFQRQGIHVVRRNVENLVKLPLRFGETTKQKVGKRVLGEQVNIARIEPLGLIEE